MRYLRLKNERRCTTCHIPKAMIPSMRRMEKLRTRALVLSADEPGVDKEDWHQVCSRVLGIRQPMKSPMSVALLGAEGVM